MGEGETKVFPCLRFFFFNLQLNCTTKMESSLYWFFSYCFIWGSLRGHRPWEESITQEALSVATEAGVSSSQCIHSQEDENKMNSSTQLTSFFLLSPTKSLAHGVMLSTSRVWVFKLPHRHTQRHVSKGSLNPFKLTIKINCGKHRTKTREMFTLSIVLGLFIWDSLNM